MLVAYKIFACHIIDISKVDNVHVSHSHAYNAKYSYLKKKSQTKKENQLLLRYHSYKTFSMLNSAEHETFPAPKC